MTLLHATGGDRANGAPRQDQYQLNIEDCAQACAAEQAQSLSHSTTCTDFLGTDNPRHLRVLQAVWVRPLPREQLDRVAGCSNGPELVAELRRRGLQMPCTRTKRKDMDMFEVWPGVYHLTQQDRRKLGAWKRRRASMRGGE